MTSAEIISWLLDGDVAVQFQVYRDLLGKNKPLVQNKIQKQGWGYEFLKYRHENGHWGRGFYQPKWTSTHYTLLDLKNLQISKTNKLVKESVTMVLQTEKGPDGGLNPSPTIPQSDVCINGMALNYASYFGAYEPLLHSVVNFLLSQEMPDGGFNCRFNRQGAKHSSLHTTLSVLEGITEYKRSGYTYRLAELQQAKEKGQEFILVHKLFRSHRTGEIINPNFLRFYYPCRWYYDILRAMDHFRDDHVKFDKRMREAIEIIISKRTADGLWKLPAAHPGNTHFDMEKAGKPSRWN
ncbi:MAG: hypothetical protein ACXWDO_09025, partial [Bacteroidia bacterium]